MTTLAKTLLHTSVADAVYKEITSKTGRYYYFVGQVIDWANVNYAPLPVDSVEYENNVRNRIAIIKVIQPGDIAYVVDRYNWTANTVYDMYDDNYSTQLAGIDLRNGGVNYSSNVLVSISGGGGEGAKANAYQANGVITSVVLTDPGIGYNSMPTITITDSFGSNAVANAVLSYSSTGAANIQHSRFYVLTDDFNIYKCLDNNNGGQSNVKPTDVSVDPITTTDGYVWKFMGTVPISLRNKFLTDTQFPIATSIRTPFYSSGEIKNVNVISSGNNYSNVRLTVSGDGYLARDPYYIRNANIVAQGTGYLSNTTVTIEDPITNVVNWVSNQTYVVGNRVKYNNNIYQVTRSGTASSEGPVHRFGYADNGTTILKFIGRTATANVGIHISGNVANINLHGSLRDIEVINPGSGYISTPNVIITGNGSNASAYAVVTDNSVHKIVVTDIGQDYTSVPVVNIGESWSANANVSVGTQLYYLNNLYTVTKAGNLNVSAPTHVTGTRVFGTANLTYAGGRSTAVATLKYGEGYTKRPNVVITGTGANANIILEIQKSEARISPVIQNGKITRVIIDDGGIGYTQAAIAIVAENGAGASLQADLAEGDLDTLQSNNELLAVKGTINAIKVVSGGYGYTGANVTISGDGTGATATATINNLRITKINITNPGSGYTTANVIITGTGETPGQGATARAIIAPYGGHGKDIVKELYSTSLAFHSTISGEKNQGFVVNNDYRQFGIIKDIFNYDGDKYYSADIGSACYVISGSVDTGLFPIDSTVTRTSDNARYIVVATSNAGILVQSIDGEIPLSTDVIRNSAGNTFNVTGVTEPDIDKYSGTLLYIDNRLAFTTSEQQAISLKTVFKY